MSSFKQMLTFYTINIEHVSHFITYSYFSKTTGFKGCNYNC